MNTLKNRHPSSFRDPAGSILQVEGRIVRGLTSVGMERYQSVKKSGLFDKLENQKKLIASKDITHLENESSFVHFLQHELIPFISYPYEWSFSLLKASALLHLSIQIEALQNDIVLTDATAYNIQFKGINPLFIDILSFRPYQNGELWVGHRQFCEQFLNPLLLTSLCGIPFQDWYRGALEGISTSAMASFMPYKSWFSYRALIHVLLPARYQNKSSPEMTKIKKASLPKSVYFHFLEQLYHWIEKLKFHSSHPTTWEKYSETRLYLSEELKLKREFIAEFSEKVKPKQLWDFGCNDGEFSEIALKNGALSAIGFDLDFGALEKAALRAKNNHLNFLPLYQQMTNQSPNQGWLLNERTAIQHRSQPDAIIALAFIHHLAIGHNIPLHEIIDWLVGLAPCGVIEFVEKSDPTTQKMLALKGDIFPEYTKEHFTQCLNKKATIIKFGSISTTGRCLYWYQRHG